MANIHIIGTSHISAASVTQVERYIREEKPNIVALELDKRRAHALLHNIKPKLSMKVARQLGMKGFAFYVIASFVQRRLGKVVGVEPGSDMKTALITALKEKRDVALIDQDISVTMQRLSKTLSWKERFRFVWDAISGPFNKETRQLGKIDLKKVPPQEFIIKVLSIMKKRYPNVHRALVEERNEYMANQLAHIALNHPDKKILAVVGAGHEQELSRLVKKHVKHHTEKNKES